MQRLVALVVFLPMLLSLQEHSTPVGFWTTIDDEDHRPTSVVEIQQVGDELVGTVREILVPATHDDSICGKCSGERHDQPIIGMEILRHLRRDEDNPDEWKGGEILDPESGKTYRAQLKLTDGGKKLILRGYIGISLFGRSQTWLRR